MNFKFIFYKKKKWLTYYYLGGKNSVCANRLGTSYIDKLYIINSYRYCYIDILLTIAKVLIK